MGSSEKRANNPTGQAGAPRPLVHVTDLCDGTARVRLDLRLRWVEAVQLLNAIPLADETEGGVRLASDADAEDRW